MLDTISPQENTERVGIAIVFDHNLGTVVYRQHPQFEQKEYRIHCVTRSKIQRVSDFHLPT